MADFHKYNYYCTNIESKVKIKIKLFSSECFGPFISLNFEKSCSNDSSSSSSPEHKDCMKARSSAGNRSSNRRKIATINATSFFLFQRQLCDYSHHNFIRNNFMYCLTGNLTVRSNKLFQY